MSAPRTVIAPDTPTPVAWVLADEEWEGDFGYWCYSQKDLAEEAERGSRFLLVEEDEDGRDVVRGVEGHVHLANFMHLAGSVEEMFFTFRKVREQIDFLTLLIEALFADLDQRVEFLTLLVDALHAEATP